jgi:hypothetical protein
MLGWRARARWLIQGFPCLSTDHREGTDRERSHSPHFDRNSEKEKVDGAEIIEATKVFDDGNARG